MTEAEEFIWTPTGFQALRIAEIRPEAGGSVVIGFDVPTDLARHFLFSPGQHLTLRRQFDGEEVRRSYSICVPPHADRLEIAVRRVQGGLFSGWTVDELRAGDMLEVMSPSGHFLVPDGNGDRTIVFIAAGSGITPIISQIASLLANNSGARVILLYLNRTIESTMFVEELLALKNMYLDRCTIWFHNSQEEADGALFSGRLTKAALLKLLDEDVLPLTADAWLLCGPQALVDMVRDTLRTADVPASKIHSELFGVAVTASSPPTAIGDAQVAIRFHGRTTTVTVPAGMSVLDAGRRVRADLPFACKTGVCSTCRARVLSGRVQMVANYALEEDEVQRGFVLSCQSYPETSSAEIDFDA